MNIGSDKLQIVILKRLEAIYNTENRAKKLSKKRQALNNIV